jgi:hypothetical protein
MDKVWNKKSVKQLESYLKERCVSVSKSRKATLVQLCAAADELDIEVDPDGLVEDRAEVIQEKLALDGQQLTNPSILPDFTNDISVLPQISIIDMYNYLITFTDYEDATFRDYHRMEGYTLKKDGYILDMVFSCYPTNNNVFAIKSRVKPRTRDNDPITKLPFYNVWIICKKDGSRIHSAYCTCKGGYVLVILLTL